LVKRGLPIEPLHHGGDQERSLRAGTINVPGVAAFAKALSIATSNLAQNANQLTILRNQLIQGVLTAIPTAILTGPNISVPSQQFISQVLEGSQAGAGCSTAGAQTEGAKKAAPHTQVFNNPNLGNRLPGNVSFVFPGCDPDALLFGLDNAGFAASIGAACAAGVAQASEALLACGFHDADARSSLRFTLGAATSSEDIQHLIGALPTIVTAAQMR